MNPEIKKRLRIAGPVLLVLLGGLLWWWLGRRPFLYAGTIEADEADLSPGVASRIAAYDIKEGDKVRKGQTLVRLACEDVRLAADQAETEYRRAVSLHDAGSMPQAQYDRIRFTRDDAAVKRSWCTITAPWDGTVVATYRQPGEWARPGMTLLTLANLAEVYAVVYVPQPLLARLAVGQAVAGRLPELLGRAFPGTIAHVREEAEFTPKNVQTRNERERLVYGVKVRFPNADGVLKPGMTIEADLTPPPGR